MNAASPIVKTANPAEWTRFFQMVLLASMLAACRPHKVVSPAIRTEEWVYTHIKHGMAEKQVIDVAGEPDRVERQANHPTELFYFFYNLPHTDGKLYFSGFQVLLSNDSVEAIMPIYGEK
jgi:hypothetical protein